MFSFRLSDQAEARLRRVSELSDDTMTKVIVSGIDVVWAFGVHDAELVAAFGTIERRNVPQWSPFAPSAECFTFSYYANSDGWQLHVEACPPSVTSMEWAVKIYATFLRGEILARAGATPPFIGGSVCGIAKSMGFH